MSKSFKKIIPYILILVAAFALTGFWGTIEKAQASSHPDEMGTCRIPASGEFSLFETERMKRGDCNMPGSSFTPDTTAGEPPAEAEIIRRTGEEQTALERLIDQACGLNPISQGCILRLFYFILYNIPAFLLWLSAIFFNAILGLALYSELYTSSTFIPEAWGIVRDLSNIFFIIVLLYIAIQTVLGIGGHGGGPKKMIAQVIIMALLINFSMFFTKVVIDSANILALVFYNKINVETGNSSGAPRAYTAVTTSPNEKDISGGMVKAFDPTQLLSEKFFTKAKENTVLGRVVVDEVPFGILLGIILIAGGIMLFAAYAFFIAGLSFLGRLIELWILIIFSPFAFMSSTLPILGHIDHVGWDAWLKRLLSAAFMAPIFMFFMYFIFKLVKADIFGNLIKKDQDAVAMILSILIPALVILILLLVATKYAKKGSGQLGEMMIKAGTAAAGLAGGLALGAAAGGAAVALRGTVGRGAANLAESDRFRNWAAKTRGGQFISNRVSGLASRTFDAREAPGAGALAKMGGVNLGAAKSVGLGPKKGFAENRAEAVKKREEFVKKQLDVSDAGKAELTRGGMDVARATELRRQMRDGGMSVADQLTYYNQMIGGGITPDDLGKVSRYINARRRDVYADRLERRTLPSVTLPSVLGTLRGPAQKRRASLRIAANKIRESADSAQKKANIAALAAGLAAAGTTPPAAGGAPPPPVAPPAPPAPCWVAEVLYGINDQRTHAARLWATTNDNWFTKLYKIHGETWAKWLTIHKWVQPVVKPIWDVIAIKGQLLAIKARSDESSLDENFNYLLEKVK